MTADERAAKLWEDLDMMYDTDDGIEGEKRDIARIAAAIRAAVAEAYERAAKVARDCPEPPDDGSMAAMYPDWRKIIARAIRELE